MNSSLLRTKFVKILGLKCLIYYIKLHGYNKSQQKRTNFGGPIEFILTEFNCNMENSK